MCDIFVEPAWAKFGPEYNVAGSITEHTLYNETKKYVAFKSKSSDNHNMRVSPVYGIIHPKGDQRLRIRNARQDAPKKDCEDKVKVIFKVVYSEEAESFLKSPDKIKHYFQDNDIHGYVEIFIRSKGLSQESSRGKMHKSRGDKSSRRTSRKSSHTSSNRSRSKRRNKSEEITRPRKHKKKKDKHKNSSKSSKKSHRKENRHRRRNKKSKKEHSRRSKKENTGLLASIFQKKNNSI